MRRLITLISAGRNRTIVIRRELPRTKNADWAVKPYHIKRWRILLSVCPRPVTGSVAISKFKAKATNQPANEAPSGAEWPAITIGRPTPVRAEEVRHPGCPSPWPDLPLRCASGARRKLSFGLHRNGPNKSQQLPSYRGYDLRLLLVGRGQLLITRVQPPLCFPGDILHLLLQALLPFPQKAAHPRSMLIRPGGFNDDPPQVGIAGFGNRAALDAVAAGVFAGCQSTIAHQLPWAGKAGQGAQFRHHRYRGDLGHTAQPLQRFHYGAHGGRQLFNRFRYGFLQPLNALGHMLDFVYIVQECGFQRWLLEVHLFLNPGHVLLGPALLHIRRRALAVPQQKFVQAMPGTHLILPGILARSHQIPQRFVRRIGNPYWREVAGAITARQFHRVAAICLYPITGLHRDQRRCDHLTGDSQRRQLPIQNIAGGTGFVAHLKVLGRPQPRYQLANDFHTVGDHAERANFTALFGNRNCDGVRVDIQTNKSYLRHATNSFRMRLCAAVDSDSQRNPRYCESGLVTPL